MSVFGRELIEKALMMKKAKVAVIGDLVGDLFIYGRTKRLSREAPVLILEHEREHLALGGAANAINNLAALKAEVFPIGLVGDDAEGENLVNLLAEKGVDASRIFKDSGRPTTIKKRILGSGLHTTYQQVLRIDNGSREPVDGRIKDNLLDQLDNVSDYADALVASDYGYGVITGDVLEKINKIAQSGTLPVLVDSRYGIPGFKFPSLITPNEPEAQQAAGIKIRNDDDVMAAAKILAEMTKAEAVCITRGKKGMCLFENGQGRQIPIFGSDEISDVTGAGDTVMAAFAASLVSGNSLYDSALLATVAGGLVVMKAGTATITVDEILSALEDHTSE